MPCLTSHFVDSTTLTTSPLPSLSALVNTMTTMSEHLNARAVVQLGKKKLEHFKKLIEGSKIAISISTNEEPCTAGENLRRCAASIEENAVIVSDPNPSLLDAMEVLIRHNMSTYTNAATIGRKRATLESDGMRFIAVCSEADLSGDDGVLYGFVAYKFNQMEDHDLTDYLYEIQVDESVQGKGLGSALVSIVPCNAHATAFPAMLQRSLQC